jgi:hypothetical protein
MFGGHIEPMSALAEPIPTGYKVGILTVIRELPRQRDKWGLRRMVECLCECGNIKVVQYGAGSRNIYKIPYSCGCITRKLVAYNPYHPDAVLEAYKTLMKQEMIDRLTQIKALEYIAMYGNLSEHQLSATIERMNTLTREVLL